MATACCGVGVDGVNSRIELHGLQRMVQFRKLQISWTHVFVTLAITLHVATLLIYF